MSISTLMDASPNLPPAPFVVESICPSTSSAAVWTTSAACFNRRRSNAVASFGTASTILLTRFSTARRVSVMASRSRRSAAIFAAPASLPFSIRPRSADSSKCSCQCWLLMYDRIALNDDPGMARCFSCANPRMDSFSPSAIRFLASASHSS